MRLKKSLTGKLTKINSPVEDQKSGKYSECPWLWGPCSKTNLPAIEIGHYLRRFKSLHKAAKDDMSCQSTWYECEWAWKMRGSLRKSRRSRSLNCSWRKRKPQQQQRTIGKKVVKATVNTYHTINYRQFEDATKHSEEDIQTKRVKFPRLT